MHSDFAAARLFLERAFVVLRGDDEVSLQAREALGLLIEACAAGKLVQRATKARMPTRRTWSVFRQAASSDVSERVEAKGPELWRREAKVRGKRGAWGRALASGCGFRVGATKPHPGISAREGDQSYGVIAP